MNKRFLRENICLQESIQGVLPRVAGAVASLFVEVGERLERRRRRLRAGAQDGVDTEVVLA
jgi:hypothetical protein